MADALTRATAAILICIYVAGFLVIAVHEARFGVTSFDFFKPKIISSGIAFGLLTLAPILGGIAFFRHRAKDLPIIVSISEFAAGAYYAAAQLGQLFTLNEPLTPAQKEWTLTASLLTGGTVIAVIAYVIVLQWKSRTKLAIVLKTVTPMILIAVSSFTASPGPRMLGFWFIGVGLSAAAAETMHGLRRDAGVDSPWRIASVHDLVVPVGFVLTAISFYSQWPFQYLKPEYGGGAPTSATLYLNETLPRWPSTTIQTKILDETAAGFYLIDTIGANPKGAVFIPRGSVKLIEFAKRGF